MASAIGSGVVASGDASIVAGTWSINQVVVDRPDYLRPVVMNSIIEKDRYMAIEASATSAANLDWFMREFADGRGGQGAARSSEEVASVLPDDRLPLYHPYLYSGRKAGPAKAGFYGLGDWYTRADMLYALFEGVTFAHRAHIDRLRAAGIAFTHATLSGGAARSCVWLQMFADVLNIPIRTAQCQETGALGAALCAGVGVGVWRNLAAGVAQAVQLDHRTLLPRADRHAFHDARSGIAYSLTSHLPMRLHQNGAAVEGKIGHRVRRFMPTDADVRAFAPAQSRWRLARWGGELTIDGDRLLLGPGPSPLAATLRALGQGQLLATACDGPWRTPILLTVRDDPLALTTHRSRIVRYCRA